MLRLTRKSRFRRSRRFQSRRGAASAAVLAAIALPAGGLLATNYISEACDTALQWVNHLDRNAWLLVLCAAVVVGGMCLRGFGSRSNY
ncbi:MAG TPA: hypothetical protein VGY55_16300 [Pirellulales bacterium]|nr:hypothetical protein [Pirellulales bacterium]